MRLTIAEAPSAVVFCLEGKVSGAMVHELRQAWTAFAPKLEGRNLVVDLSGTLYIDGAGLSVLAEIYRDARAEFQSNSPLTEYFAQQAKRAEDRDGKDETNVSD
jgi:anti-anti-sigma factor